MDDVLLVSISIPTARAETLARALVTGQHAACVQVSAPVQSIYCYNGALESGEESVLSIKTTAAAYPALERMVVEFHPYETPEIIATAVTQGLPPYLEWVRENSGAPTIS